jgi:hypothetical protein
MAKALGGKAIHSGLGSIDLTGAVRTEMMAGSLADDPNSRAMCQVKNNLSVMAPALGYRIDADGRFAWTGQSQITAAEIMEAPSTSEDRSAVAEAVDWLRDFLAAGAREQQKCRDGAEGAGISPASLKRAKLKMNVKSDKKGFDGAWFWELPKVAT